MQHSRLLGLSVLLCATAVAAQEGIPQPPKQVQKFAPLVGTWQGSGTVVHQPGVPPEEWQAESSARWVLGGHFVREDVRIDMASAPAPLEFCNLYGWDRENERYVVLEVANMGKAALKEVHWTPDGKMVTGGSSVVNGMPVVERWVSELDGDTVRFAGHQAIGGGPFYEHVTGEMKRGDAQPSDVNIVDAAFMPEVFAAVRKPMTRLAALAGSYRMKGWFVMAPGAPKQQFTGQETVRPIFGGTVLEMVSEGDPIPGMGRYEGLGWMAWDDHAGCYEILYANNMGEINIQECRFVGDAMVVTGAMLYQGTPSATRGLIRLGDDGGFEKYTGHMLIGTHEPQKVFEATYTRS